VSKTTESTAGTGPVVARNSKARHDYHILETWEAGIVLAGTEIKSVRAGKVSLAEAFGVVRRGELWLEGMTIAQYESGGYVNHEPLRTRKLLLHVREIRRLIGAVEQKQHDKREDLKRRVAEREAARAMGRRR
jgi:SsrA-binding protein